MLFRRYLPCPALRPFVEDFWLYDGYTGEHVRERILPTGTFEMVFNLAEDELRIYGGRDAHGPLDADRCRRFAGALVSGPYAGTFLSDTLEEAAVMGVHFRPGGAAAILGLPADRLANAHVDLDQIWGPDARRLREELCELRVSAARFRLLERRLLQRLAAAYPRRHGAVAAGLERLVRTHGATRVRDVARALDLSQRRLTELFAGEVGLTPKLFGRVQRFQHALALLEVAPAVDWAQFAVECGYFDQSHLIHEFVEFSMLTPSDYLRHRRRLERASAHVKRHHLPVLK